MTIRGKLAIAVAVTSATAIAGTAAFAGGGDRRIHEVLSGYQEVPAVSTAASGRFQATLSPTRDGFAYKISYSGLEGDVTQSHIHLGQKGVNGAISVFFCSNLGNGPVGTQACPPAPATVEGTITSADVIGPTAQGIAPSELGELQRAIRAGVTYANVHSTKFPSGEVRAQISVRGGHGRGHGR